jgi:hypothetical protein
VAAHGHWLAFGTAWCLTVQLLARSLIRRVDLRIRSSVALLTFPYADISMKSSARDLDLGVHARSTAGCTSLCTQSPVNHQNHIIIRANTKSRSVHADQVKPSPLSSHRYLLTHQLQCKGLQRRHSYQYDASAGSVRAKVRLKKVEEKICCQFKHLLSS